MIILALDTCDSRGSVAVLRDNDVLVVRAHQTAEDYSSWILPNVELALSDCGLSLRDVELYAAAAGPGSFTALRVGLTTVKAWSEVYGAKIAGISRLEAIASQAEGQHSLVAGLVDAHRQQVFAGLFRKDGSKLELVEEEMVVAPERFLNWVSERAGASPVAWVSLDPEKLTTLPLWTARAERGELLQPSSNVLAPLVGRIALERAKQGRVVDALALDAEYVRRSDAEIFWKGHAHG